MEIIDLPQDILATTTITWTMEMNHGFVASPFSGGGQVQRGQLERWLVEFDFRGVKPEDAGEVEGFFMQLEGKANVFRMHDPSQCKVNGKMKGNVTLSGAHDAGTSVLTITGANKNIQKAFKAGDWIQIGNHLAKVKKTMHTNSAGNGSVSIFPKLHSDFPSGQKIIYVKPSGLFRFMTDAPSWKIKARAHRTHTFKLTGMQEVLADSHPLT